MTGPIITVALATMFASGANVEVAEKKKPANSAIKHAELFKKLDANSDGKVSFEEFRKLPDFLPKPKKEKGTKGHPELEKVFKHLDKNSDGVLSLEEFKEFGKQAAAKKKKTN